MKHGGDNGWCHTPLTDPLLGVAFIRRWPAAVLNKNYNRISNYSTHQAASRCCNVKTKMHLVRLPTLKAKHSSK